MRRRTPKTKVPRKVVPGVYHHYKDALYLVLGVARNANADSERSIVYMPLEPHGDEVPMLTYRKVDGKDGFFTPVRIKGKLEARFKFLYPVNTTQLKRPTLSKK
jgi:hypothetical protein